MPIANYDFHTHTTASDGALPPLALLNLAKENGVEILAVTDHDTTKGIEQLIAMQNCEKISSDIKLIAGAEFTCLLDRQILHIVGLNLQLDNPELISHIADLEKLREIRARKIADKLIKKNLPDLLPLVYEKAAGAQIGRPHFAQVMCDLNIVSSPAAAFKKYLGAGKSANVSVDWPELSVVLNLINQAGGVAVLAHPTKYRLTMSKLRKIIARFSELGGEAIEISYPGITREQQNILVYEVEKHDLMVSAGSDFHTPENKWITLGHYPPVPDKLKHVLEKIC
jgi:predicted metal-dependent phosphoesterase TrpH